MDDMSKFLSQAKEAFPDKNLVHITGGGNNIAYFEYFTPVDYLGSGARPAAESWASGAIPMMSL